MRNCAHRLSGYRTTCLIVCGLYSLLSASILARGVAASMATYEVPAATLASPHYQDAIWWVYCHMLLLGLITGLVGLYGEGPRFRRAYARLMLVAHLYYTYLDTRASDSIFGEGLYRGPGSLAPAIVCLFVTALFAHLSFCDAAPSPAPTTPQPTH